MRIEKGDNRHSFTLSSNGYRLVFSESDKELPKGYPYCYRFGIVSYDGKGDFARFGIGKVERNDATSFLDGVEKQIVCLQEARDKAKEEIKEQERKLKAIEEFLEVMPKIFIDGGIQSENGVNENETK